MIAAIVAAVSAVAGAYSAKKAQEAENAKLDYQARIARLNAEFAKTEGDLNYQSALREEQVLRGETENVFSNQINAYSATGVKVSSKSAQDSYFRTLWLGEQDAYAIRFKGELDRWKGNAQADILEEQASMYEAGKGDPNEALLLGLLGGASKTYSAYDQGGGSGSSSGNTLGSSVDGRS